MAIKAKGRTLIRLIGAVLIAISVITTMLFNIGFFNNLIAYFFILLIVLPWFLFSSLLKLEVNFFTETHKKVISILIIYSIALILLSIMWNIFLALLITIETLLILAEICCWHFSLSIYKIEKYIFFISGVLYIAGQIILINLILVLNHPIIIIDLFLVSLGILLIISIEFNLRKKGFLKYI